MEEFEVEYGKGIIPEGTTVIPDLTFKNREDLERIDIPRSVEKIGTGAFCGCSRLEHIIITHDRTTEIGPSAFQGCSGLKQIEIPSSVTDIGESVFQNCTGLTDIVIPSSVTVIPEYAFKGCSELTSVIIPERVAEIGHYAFQGCSKLKYVEFIGYVKYNIEEDAFDDCPLSTIFVQANTIDFYKKRLPEKLHNLIVEKSQMSAEEIRLRVICAVLSGRFANKEYPDVEDYERKKFVSDAIRMADEVILQMKQKQ